MSKNLKHHRESYQLTQQQLAERLDVSQQTIARWESGVSPIPAKYLKDLAVLFGEPVTDFLGDAPTAKGKVVPIRSVKKREDGETDNLPFGGVQFRFTSGVGLRSDLDYWYPISEGTRAHLVQQIETSGYAEEPGVETWLQFESMDNRWVAINSSQIADISIISDDEEQMPPYLHEEIYKAARELIFLDGPVEVGTNGDDLPYSEQLTRSAKDLISDLGGMDAALLRLEGAAYELASGQRQQGEPENETLLALVSTFNEGFDPPHSNRLINMYSEGTYQATYVRLGSLRLIEVSLMRMREMKTNDLD